MIQNVKYTVSGTKLTIEVDLSQKGEKSASGKSTVVASTHGNTKIEGTDMVLGLNLYRTMPKDQWTDEMILSAFRKKHGVTA